MTREMNVDVKIYKNNDILKQLKEPVVLDTKNWSSYLQSLRTIQKNVNVFLTSLVEEQKGVIEQAAIADDYLEQEDSDENEEIENLSFKRKCNVKPEKNKKRKNTH